MSKGEVANSIAAVRCGNQRTSGRGKLVGADHRLVGAFGGRGRRPVKVPTTVPVKVPTKVPESVRHHF